MTLKETFHGFADSIKNVGQSAKVKTSEKLQHYGLIFIYLEIGGLNFRDEKIKNYIENIYGLLKIHTSRSYDLANEESEELWGYIEMKKRNDRKFKQKLQKFSSQMKQKKKSVMGKLTSLNNPVTAISTLKDKISKKEEEVLDG